MKALSLMLGLLSPCLSVAADCLGRDPLQAGRQLFERHYEFYYAATSDQLGWLASDELAALLRREQSCTAQAQLCAIDIDPWLAAQDGQAEAAKFKLVGAGKVAVDYAWNDGRRTAYLHLQQAPSGCWRLSDLVGPDGGSLRLRLQDFYRQFPEH